MPYAEVVPGWGLARLLWGSTEGTDHAECVFGWENDGELTAGAAAEVIYNAYISSGMINTLSALATIQGVTTVANTGGVLSEGEYMLATVGGGGGAITSPQVAWLVQKQSGLIGRHFKGRFYFPYFNPAAITVGTNQLTSETQSSWQGLATAFLNAMSSGGVTLGLLHKDLAIPPTNTLVLTVEATIATQRRRNRKAAHR